ncbi:protein of unknown function DUF395, YeeE/YedE [Shewanella sediminis HAW-EB3]|uniref:YeeE/YedE family protein n=1 Tax=Shewanella sediminis (strain HAW-EB3) TaxID=425104 RepID=A8FZQ6_SHESH|nr:YeeE/YedE family protein [Shewanella sediminis]ABV38329.1 protein of unknown function DUF395, YeeE/YedE [Shewanella sediminis HAW-EB3]
MKTSSMKRKITALLSGILFGAGLLLSGLADPAKVIGFLDVSRVSNGTWDPSLMVVMTGALAVYMSLYYLVVKPRVRANLAPVCDTKYHLPEKKTLDSHLILGASLFGLGWGMVGICPGPAIVNIATLDMSLGLFVVAMLFGLYIGKLIKSAEVDMVKAD